MALTTYQDIQNRTLDLLNKSDNTTRNRVKEWINLGQSDFVMRELWPFRETVGTLTTVASTQEYTLSTEFSDIDAGNIVSVTLQGANQTKLAYWPFNQLQADHPDLDESTGVPQRYYIRDGKIGFWPVPNGAYTVKVDYYATPTALDADGDTSIIPVNYRESLMHYALSLEHDYNTDPDLAQKAMNRYEQIVTLARNNLLAQPTDTGAFRILGPADSRNHTGMRSEIR